MEERTYFSVAAEWWADAARKVNEEYDMKLSRDTIICFEKELATEIKESLMETMQEHNIPYSANADVFYCISLERTSPIIRDTLKKLAIQCVVPVLPDDVMIVSSSLVFIREACNYEFMHSDRPLSCNSDEVIFGSQESQDKKEETE